MALVFDKSITGSSGKVFDLDFATSPYRTSSCAQVVGTEVYIRIDEIEKLGKAPEGFAGDRDAYKMKNSRGEKPFYEMLKGWLGDGFDFYRGLSISHFSYPDCVYKGTIKSEGDNDLPTFTMAKAGTKWLPGCWEADLCESLALSIDCPYTKALPEFREGVMPLGITIKVRVGKDCAVKKVAWMNDGEQCVPGPIAWPGEFVIHSIQILNQSNFANCQVPPTFSLGDLPPVRPYHVNASPGIIKIWYKEHCMRWVERVTLMGSTLTVKHSGIYVSPVLAASGSVDPLMGRPL
jgi:hypothetical protein